MREGLLQAVEAVARVAGDVAFRHFRSGLRVETKEDGSPVTVADREAEQAARAWITQRFPDDGIVGEEFGTREGTSGRRWFLDPIDGTKTFVRGVPLWGSLVGVAVGDEVVAGAAWFPAVNELIAAESGKGCWWNGERAAVSGTSTLAGATVLITDERAFATSARRESWRTLTGESGLARTWGDCYGYLLVATGRAEVMVDPALSPWDIACFLPIIEEAGGVITDLAGERTAFGGNAIATNRALAGIAREFFAA